LPGFLLSSFNPAYLYVYAPASAEIELNEVSLKEIGMTVRKPLNESTDVNNDAVLSGEGADVGAGVLDEDEVVVDVNDDGDIITQDDDLLNEDGGGDTGTDVDDISDAEIDSMLNEDNETFDESNLDNFGDEKAPPFKKGDGGAKNEAEEKPDAKGGKEGSEDNGKGEDGDAGEDGKDAKGGKEGEEGKDKMKEDFEDPGEIIDPALYTDAEEPVVEEFGAIPDVIPDLPDEPIVDLGDEVGTEVDLESGVAVPSYEVEVPFVLPESRRVVVGKGDVIFYCGKANKELPSFAESTFAQAVNLLVKSKKLKGTFLSEGTKSERVALIGRSCLVEVARDWRLPGTDTIFEAGDVLQIVSRKQVVEKEVKVKK
jgi:hypothetical protein